MRYSDVATAHITRMIHGLQGGGAHRLSTITDSNNWREAVVDSCADNLPCGAQNVRSFGVAVCRIHSHYGLCKGKERGRCEGLYR